MIYNHLFVKLNLESRVLLHDLFQGCPIQVDLNAPVTLMITPDMPTPDHVALYQAQLMPLQIQYDPITEIKTLVLPIMSESLMGRYEGLIEQGIRPAYGDFYFPHIMLNADLPPVRHRYKSILNSLSDAFVSYQHKITLGEETVVTEDFDSQPATA